MTSVPYPSFRTNRPVCRPKNDGDGDAAVALSAVGRCRFCPTSLADDASLYRSIVDKNIEQARMKLEQDVDDEEKKKLEKKFMKQGVALASEYLTSHFELDVSIIDIEIVVDPNDLIQSDGCIAACLLDAGCDIIVIPYSDVPDNTINALLVARIPPERLMVDFGIFQNDVKSIQAAMEQVKSYCRGVSVHVTNINEATISNLLALGSNELKMTVEILPNDYVADDDNDDLPTLVGRWCTSLKEQKNKRCIALIDPTATMLGKCYSACIKTDRVDLLYSTVVCTRTGEALGLVYSSIESIIASLQCGRGVYYSRSRSSLWRKGDTSGCFQVLHRIDIDCDGDAVRFIVTQMGAGDDAVPAFCHLNTLSCWGQSRGMNHLQEVLKNRLLSAPVGSYTKRLFDDNTLLRNKLIEEVQELVEADTRQHVAEELADVLYFALTCATKSGVTLDDAVIELDKRSRKVTRRQGDSKLFRIAVGEDILNSNKKEEGDSDNNK